MLIDWVVELGGRGRELARQGNQALQGSGAQQEHESALRLGSSHLATSNSHLHACRQCRLGRQT